MAERADKLCGPSHDGLKFDPLPSMNRVRYRTRLNVFIMTFRPLDWIFATNIDTILVAIIRMYIDLNGIILLLYNTYYVATSDQYMKHELPILIMHAEILQKSFFVGLATQWLGKALCLVFALQCALHGKICQQASLV